MIPNDACLKLVHDQVFLDVGVPVDAALLARKFSQDHVKSIEAL